MDFIQGLIKSLSSFIHRNNDDDNHAAKVSHEPVEEDDKHRKTDGNGEKEEVIDGNLYVDGVNLGPLKSGSMPGDEDILHLLKIPKNYTIPEHVMLPSDLANVKFRNEPNGFAKDDVADFYDIIVSSIDYYIELLNKRNDDIKKLADYIDELNDDIHDKEMELQIQKTGLTVIADSDSNNENMNLSLKIRKLAAENKSLKARLSETEASKQISELKKKYDEIQDQLAMEQYDNKQLNEKLSELQSKLHAIQENGTDNEVDFAEQIGSIHGGSNAEQHEPSIEGAPSVRPRKNVSLTRRKLSIPDSHSSNDNENTEIKPLKMAPHHTLRKSIPKTGNDSPSVSIHDLEQDESPTPSHTDAGEPPHHSNLDNALSSLENTIPDDEGDDDVSIFDDSAPFDEVTDQILNDKIDFD